MRTALDPLPLVLGIYAYVGKLLARAAQRREGDDAAGLAARFAQQRGQPADREVRRLLRSLHADVKTADKLLKKTADIWKISAQTDLVDLVVQARGQEPEPKAYVLLQPPEIRALLQSILEAARAAGENEETLDHLEQAADALEARPGDYLAFGFAPWGA
ncbi:MAG: hypothetical protein HY703_03000 [Gemmatimonadetes bacterium]|nr:hypothetical protein [Gemmatimonadota bacterium]